MNEITFQFILKLSGITIGGLLTVLFWIVRLYIHEIKNFRKEQNEQNKEFYILINKTNLTLERLNTTIEEDRKICDLRHNNNNSNIKNEYLRTGH